MYQFHYEYIGTNITTVLSFIYRHRLWHKFFLQTQIESDDVYEDFYENKSFFDFCDYPENFLILSMKNYFAKWKMKSKENKLVNLLD